MHVKDAIQDGNGVPGKGGRARVSFVRVCILTSLAVRVPGTGILTLTTLTSARVDHGFMHAYQTYMYT